MAIRLGMEAVLNYKTGASSWTELANVRDVTLTLETQAAGELTARLAAETSTLLLS